jgi:signal transduction histidine kinase
MASLASAGKFASRLGGTTLGVGVIVLVLGGAGLWIWLDRVDSLREAHSTALRLVHVLGEQTERTVQTVDLILTGLADTLGSAPDLPDHDPAFQDKMRALLHPSPFIRALFVVGPDGFLTHDTNHPNTPPVSAADRDYFMAHAERDDFGLFIGTPLQSRRVGTWFVSVSRRVPSADGSFAGIVVAAVEPRYFEQFYSGLRLGATDSIALFRRDGTLVARYPHVGTAIGQSYASYEPFKSQLETMSTGSFETDGVIGGSARVLAYRTVDGTPLVVAVGLDKQTLLADWQQRALVTSGSALGIALLGAASVILLIRHQRERAAVRQHLAQAQKLDAVGQMAAGIVHDFRNLLAVVASGGRLLRRRVPDPALAPILDEIDAAVERGTTLTSKLLSFSRQDTLDLEVVDVNQLLSALQPLMNGAAGPGVRLELRLAPEVGPCRLDRTQFDRALLNLIINARDAMPKGGELRIATANFSERAGLGKRAGLGRAMLPPGDYVRVRVADNGQGMTPEVARRVLEPFYTTKGEAGTGLGLSQVYGFVRQVGGDLRIESGRGAGTTVELFFPRCAPNSTINGSRFMGRSLTARAIDVGSRGPCWRR